MTTDNKLYVRVDCTVCLGKLNSSCPYCKPTGLTYIEAADKVILQWLNTLDKERLDYFLSEIKKSNNICGD